MSDESTITAFLARASDRLLPQLRDGSTVSVPVRLCGKARNRIHRGDTMRLFRVASSGACFMHVQRILKDSSSEPEMERSAPRLSSSVSG